MGLIEIAIESRSDADRRRLLAALRKTMARDPSITVYTDPESGQTVLTGTDEMSLDATIDILKRTFKVEANIGAPQVLTRRLPRQWTVFSPAGRCRWRTCCTKAPRGHI